MKLGETMNVADVLFWLLIILFISGFITYLYACYHAWVFSRIRLQAAPIFELLILKTEVPEAARPYGRRALIGLIIFIICFVLCLAGGWLAEHLL